MGHLCFPYCGAGDGPSLVTAQLLHFALLLATALQSLVDDVSRDAICP